MTTINTTRPMTDQQQALADLLETFVPAGTIAGGIAYARIGWQDEGELRTAIAAAQEFAATAALAVSIMERVARARLADAGVSEDDEQAPGLWPAALRYVPDHELQAAADAVTPGDVTAELPAAELMSVTAERLKRFRSTDY